MTGLFTNLMILMKIQRKQKNKTYMAIYFLFMAVALSANAFSVVIIEPEPEPRPIKDWPIKIIKNPSISGTCDLRMVRTDGDLRPEDALFDIDGNPSVHYTIYRWLVSRLWL